MNKLERILVANDDLRGLETAISKAEVLEHFTGSSVEVAQVVWDPIEEEDELVASERANLISAYMAAERASLHRLMAPHRQKVAWSEERVLWNKRPYEAICKEVDSRRIDLLIKPVSKRSMLDFVHTPLDWALIRDIHCPVLISKSEAWQIGGSIVAAIDTQGQHSSVNNEIISIAVLLGEILQADIHLVTVAPDPRHSISPALVSEMIESRKEKLQAIATSSKLHNIKVHVELGSPAKAIASLSKKLNATLAVLGTHSRTGAQKWVLGNTVEKALGLIECDTLSIRVPR